MAMDNILDPSKLSLEGDFEDQVNHLLMKVRLTKDEVESLQQLVDDVGNTLGSPWPGCRIFTFGSIVTGLGIATSDIDMFVALPPWVIIEDNLVFQAKAFLQSKRFIFSEVLAIERLYNFPIVKCLHVRTNRYCDINFTSRLGVENSRLLGYLLHMDQRAIPLAILIKYWSKVHNLTGTNLLPNHALTILVIFYLQHVKILPSVHLLQQAVPLHMVDGWNCRFDDNSQSFKGNDIKLPLYELLGGFFDYYSNFDFEKEIVSPYLGRPVEKESFKQIATVPAEYDLYKYNLSNNVCQELIVDTKMCVQDLFEHSNNCSMAVRPKLFNIVLKYFKQSAQLFYEKENDNYLKAILTFDHLKADEKIIKSCQRRKPQRHPQRVIKQSKKPQRGLGHKIKMNSHMIHKQKYTYFKKEK